MKPIKVRDAHQEFINFLKTKKHSNATILAYGKDVDQLATFLEELEKEHVHDVSKDDIQAFLGKLAEMGYTPKSLSRKLNSTRTFYRFLKVNEFITDDPSLLVSHPHYELAAPRILKPTEYRALRDAARNDNRMYAIIELLLQTGIRIGELADIRLADIQNDHIHIRPHEKHEERDVPINKSAKEALNRFLHNRPNVKDDHVFITKSGNMRIKKIVFLFIVIVSLFIINNLIHSIYSLWQKQELVVNARQELEREKTKNKNLKDELTRVNKPQFIEEEARDKLFLAKPGEKIIVIPSTSLKVSQSASLIFRDTRPNWKKWWDLFF